MVPVCGKIGIGSRCLIVDGKEWFAVDNCGEIGMVHGACLC